MNDVQALTARIEELERKNRRTLRLGGAALGLLTAAGLVSWCLPICNTVSAERFVLKDQQGRDRGVFTAYETGGAPRFSLYGNNGKAVASLSVEADGAALLSLYDAKAEKSVRVSVGADGSPRMEGSCATKSGCDKPCEKAPAKDAGTVGMATR
jgi:hypothetical protein